MPGIPTLKMTSGVIIAGSIQLYIHSEDFTPELKKIMRDGG